MFLYPSIPENPLIHPKNSVSVFDVYVIISLPIFKRPYSTGYPFVEDTVIVVSEEEISLERVVFPIRTSGIKLSSFKYLSRLLIKSSGEP